MLEAIVAGVIAHGIYHYTMDIAHSEDETHHIQKTEEIKTQNTNVAWVFESAKVQGR